MKKAMLAVFISACCAFPAQGVDYGVEWREELDTPHYVWNWLAERKGHDEESWRTLTPAAQRAEVKDAMAVCRRAQRQASYADGSAGGEALLRTSDFDLESVAKCLVEGQSVAADLREKRDRLAAIKHKASKGRCSQDDLDWMRDSGLTLRLKAPKSKGFRRGGSAPSKLERKLNEDVPVSHVGAGRGSGAAGKELGKKNRNAKGRF